MSAKALREKKAELAGVIRKLADKANTEAGLDAAERERWDEVNKDYDALNDKVEKIERAESIESELEAVNDVPGREDTPVTPEGKRQATSEDKATALQAWARRSRGQKLEDRHIEAAELCGVNLDADEFEIKLPRSEMRGTTASMTTAASDGGDTIPTGFVPNFERARLAFGGVRPVATVIRTDTGNQLTWPTTDDTSNKGALLAEATEDSQQDVTTSYMQLDAYKYTSKIIKVSSELLQDSAFDLASVLGSMIGERLGRIESDQMTTGTGSSQPNGIVTASALGVTAASATAFTEEELVDLQHSVDPAYRSGAGWMMHDSVVKTIRKIKDSYDRFVWQPGLREGNPDLLLGQPIQVNQSMASTVEASAKVVLYGLLSKYIIRDVASLTLKTLSERYAEFDVVAFVGLVRMDGDLLDAGTNPVKYLQMAAGSA